MPVRRWSTLVLLLSALFAPHIVAQSDSSGRSATFLTRRDLGIAGAVFAGTALLTLFDDDIAIAAQQPRFKGDSGLTILARRASKVHETTLTLAGVVVYGVGRLTGSRTVSDIALHATESVVLASVASQLIRGPLGRTRPYVTNGTDQYDFRPFKGFFGKASFDNRAFPSIHTSSSLAVATVLVMETHRRAPRATPFAAPVLFSAALLPALARIKQDQHWASDIAAGAFMGIFAGYKVVTYSHDHPNNRFDRFLLSASVSASPNGGIKIGLSPTF